MRVRRSTNDLFITEGIRKGDAAVSKGLACVALLGVWNWRGTDESGAITVLPDWEEIHLKGRTVYIVFDSDVMTKLSVKKSLERLARFLRARGAAVKLVYLPAGSAGEKVGLDDWFANGGSVTELKDLAEDQVRGMPQIVVNARQLPDVTRTSFKRLSRRTIRHNSSAGPATSAGCTWMRRVVQ